jgi:hypothetical protein
MRMLAPFALVLLPGCACANAQYKPFDLSVGWNYGYTDQGNGLANLNGWYGTGSWEFSPHVGASVEHESFWGALQGSRINQHLWLGGITVKLRRGNPKISLSCSPWGVRPAAVPRERFRSSPRSSLEPGRTSP